MDFRRRMASMFEADRAARATVGAVPLSIEFPFWFVSCVPLCAPRLAWRSSDIAISKQNEDNKNRSSLWSSSWVVVHDIWCCACIKCFYHAVIGRRFVWDDVRVCWYDWMKICHWAGCIYIEFHSISPERHQLLSESTQIGTHISS